MADLASGSTNIRSAMERPIPLSVAMATSLVLTCTVNTGRPLYFVCQAKTKPQSTNPPMKMAASRYQTGRLRFDHKARRGRQRIADANAAQAVGFRILGCMRSRTRLCKGKADGFE